MDSSAILALLADEPGKEKVIEHIAGAIISTVNVAEIYAKANEAGVGIEPARRAVAKLRLDEVPFDSDLAFITGTLRDRTRMIGLSLGDRACLALALSRNLPVLTGDKQWREVDIGVQVYFFR